jgi:hypothetical protein
LHYPLFKSDDCSHQWIFISDTVDAVKEFSGDCHSALLARLGAKLSGKAIPMPIQEGNMYASVEDLASSRDELGDGRTSTEIFDAPLESTGDRRRSPSISFNLPSAFDSSQSPKRRPVIPSGWTPSNIDSIQKLVPFLESISRRTFTALNTTADVFYNPFPSSNDAQPLNISDSRSGARTTLNGRTIDVDYVERWVESDFLDGAEASAARSSDVLSSTL